jgi:GTP-binding protein EngB required for normal cell division
VSDNEAWSDTDESVGSAEPTSDHAPTGNLEEAWWDTEDAFSRVRFTGDQVPAGNFEEAWSDTDESLNVVTSTSDQILPGDQGPTSDTVPGPNDVFIAVMGVTGSGKSSFIETCSGKSVTVGHDLESCTTDVQRYRYDMSPDRAVWLIDTPGFDDTNRLDTDVLTTIAEYLVNTYKAKILLHGIIYLHRITDNRMTGAAKTNKETFQELCGQDALKKVILATTMWDEFKNLTKYKQAETREKELKQRQEFWGYMLEKGSSYHRYENTRESAQDIVNSLAKHNEPIVTALQKEIVDDHRTLIETSAGHILHDDIIKVQEGYEKRIEKMEKDMKKTIDVETRSALQEERERYEQMIEEAKSSTRALDVTMGALVERDELINQMQRQMEMQQVEHQSQLRRLEQRQLQVQEENNELERARRKERRKEKKMRDESRDREAQKSRAKLAQPTVKESVIIHRTKTTTKGSIDLPYSIAMTTTLYFASSGLQIRKNAANPPEKSGSSWLTWVTFGTNSDKGGTPWMARYENGEWLTGMGLEEYPELNKQLSTRELSTLTYCVLGPKRSYYALWGATWQAWGPKSLMAKLAEVERGQRVISLAFGYGNSFLLSYGRHDALENLNTYWNLDGHYPVLEAFLKEHRPLNVIQIALDQRSITDFAIVTAKNNQYSLKLVSSKKEVREGILAWWADSKPS